MSEKITAVTRITYDPRTDLVEITGRRATGGYPAQITKYGYEVVNATVMGYGDHNAIIHVSTDVMDGEEWIGSDRDAEHIGGYWLATIEGK